MTIEIRFGAYPEDAVALTLSPLSETVCALEAIVNPRAHPLQLSWILDVRKHLPDSLHAEIRNLGFAYRDWQLGFFTPRLRNTIPTFEEELADLERLPLRTFVEECARAFTPWEAERDPTYEEVMKEPRVESMLLSHADVLDSRYVEVCRQLIHDPEGLRRRLLGLLEAFWTWRFSREWEQMQPELAADIERRARQLRHTDVFTLLRDLAPDATVIRHKKTVVFRRLPEDVVVDLTQGQHLLLVPSRFTRIKTRVECDPPWQPCLIYALEGVRLQHPPLPPERLQRALFALAHEVRLQILKLCKDGPKSTQELARALSLSEAAVSRHLKLLSEAELVEGRRESYYVMYRTHPEAVERVGGSLVSFLG